MKVFSSGSAAYLLENAVSFQRSIGRVGRDYQSGFGNIERTFAHIQHQTHRLQSALLKIEKVRPSGIEEAREAMEDGDGITAV
jgi:CRISPR/Cas system-associated endonuclease Cas3-HD